MGKEKKMRRRYPTNITKKKENEKREKKLMSTKAEYNIKRVLLKTDLFFVNFISFSDNCTS
jgi:hypothetical protein